MNPAGAWRGLWPKRDLIRQFVAREVLDKHRGAYLGVAWNLLNPLLSLAAFTFIFGFVFQRSWGNTGAPTVLDFALNFFCGQTLFHVFAESVGRAPTAVSGRPNLVKKVVFPLEILPLSIVGSSLVYMGVSLALLLVVVAAVTGGVSATLWAAPLVFVPLVGFSLGLSWFLASLGAYVRDVRYVVGVLVNLLMFMSAIFYPASAIPEPYRAIVEWNPMAIVVESGRRTLVAGELPDWLALGAATALALVVMQGGYAWFMRTRRGFADVV